MARPGWEVCPRCKGVDRSAIYYDVQPCPDCAVGEIPGDELVEVMWHYCGSDAREALIAARRWEEQ